MDIKILEKFKEKNVVYTVSLPVTYYIQRVGEGGNSNITVQKPNGHHN